jgi:glycerate kinase
VLALVGTLEATPADLQQIGVQAAWSILPHPCSLDEALSTADVWLTAAAHQMGNLLALFPTMYRDNEDR